MTDDDRPHLVLRRAALRRGIPDDEIARLRRAGAWTTLQRGAYLVGAPDLDASSKHHLAVHATMAGLRTPAVVSHASAVVLHGLPVWRVPLQRVHITRNPPARSDVDTRLRSHRARLVEGDVTEVGGWAVTTAARTVVDVARWLPFAPALTVADAALRSAKASREDLAGALERAAGTRGARAAARVVAAADRRSESVGESRSRAAMIEMGLLLPDLQFEVVDPSGALIGRTDFAWRNHRLLGEFDGRIKYGRLLRPGKDAGDAVFEEKLREDALRAEGYGVVRWIWRDLDWPVQWAAGLRRRLAQAA